VSRPGQVNRPDGVEWFNIMSGVYAWAPASIPAQTGLFGTDPDPSTALVRGFSTEPPLTANYAVA
jgi:hypothetical protein